MAIIITGNGDDIVNGTSNPEIIISGKGNDKVKAGLGNDTIFSGDGNDTVDGGDGNDKIDGGLGDDIIFGGLGDDNIFGGDGNDKIDGGLGIDILNGGAGNDTVDGGDGNDKIDGGLGDDIIFGGNGNDRVNGGDGNDKINGGSGNDTILSENGSDTIDAGAGDDAVNGGSGNDLFIHNVSLNVDSNSSTSDFYNGESGRDNLKFIVTPAQLADMKVALAAFAASNKSQVFDFKNYVSYLDLKVVNIETVSIEVLNQAPTNITLSKQSVAENAKGAIIGNLAVLDPDLANTHTLTLTDPSRKFEIVNGQLKLKAGESLNFEDKSSYDIALKATDAGGLSVTKAFTIAVTNVNEAPTNITLSKQSVAENATGAIIGNLAVLDPDLANTHTLTLTDPSGKFEIVNGQLKLKAGVSLNFEDKSSYDIALKATDAGGLSVTKAFTIAVTNVNEAPVLKTQLDNKSGIENQSFSFTVPASIFSDPENNALTLMATLSSGDALPTWLTFDATTRTFSGTPPVTARLADEVLSVRVTASDGTFSVFDDFDLTLKQDPFLFDHDLTDTSVHSLPGEPFLVRPVTIINMPDTSVATLGQMLDFSINGSNQYQFTLNDGINFGNGVSSNITPVANTKVTFQLDTANNGVDQIYTVTLGTKAAETITLTSPGLLYGFDGDDTLTGSNGDDYIHGGAGDDILIGGAGDDTLIGGAGDDTLIGGAGDDIYIISNEVGFKITGQMAGDLAGWSVSSAGDVNGDGIDDLIVGARGNDGFKGAAYVVYGKDTRLSNIDLSDTLSTQGFKITGQMASDLAGVSVSSAGDVNGDGIDDLIVGAYGNDGTTGNVNDNRGAAYVIFGKDAKVNGDFTNIDLSDTLSTQGFKITGQMASDVAGVSVSSAGDVNGDGIDDLIVGAPGNDGFKGAAYVVFGKDTKVNGDFTNITLSDNLGTQEGFKITGQMADDEAGTSVSSAGDVNGDGIDDLIVGAFGNDSNGLTNKGAAYVIYGKDTELHGDFTNITLSDNLGTQGFKITGQMASDRAGVSVSSAGDVNRDGIDDLIVGAYRNDGNGLTNNGAAYVIYGKDAKVNGDFTNITLSDTLTAQEPRKAMGCGEIGRRFPQFPTNFYFFPL